MAKVKLKTRASTNGKKGGRPVTPKDQKRTNVQSSLSPTAMAILKEWGDSYGGGTRSYQIDTAIRFAHRHGLFNPRRQFEQAESMDDAKKLIADVPANLQEAVNHSLKALAPRLLEILTSREGLSWRRQERFPIAFLFPKTPRRC